MRVAIIGNMNNCFFTLMRYFRDLNIDAHLYLYENEYEHFKPENDTYRIDKYKDYIHILPVANSGKGLILANSKELQKILKPYDLYIGYGIAPALFRKIDYTLDIFIPYSDRIELVNYDKFQFKNLFKYPVRLYTRKEQIAGIKFNTTKVIASGIESITKEAIEMLGIKDKYIRNYLIMIYNKEELDINDIEPYYIDVMKNRDIVIFSHTRHHWKNLIESYERNGVKGIDRLIIGYSKFVKDNPNINSILILFEYGKDVEFSKELIKELGIEKYVEWFPLMPRKKILQLIDYADIVVNSLGSPMWGGVGFEALSRGKILMQNFELSNKEFQKLMGHPLPSILRAYSAEDVKDRLNEFIKNKEYYKKEGEKNREWFDKYAGIGLAKEYKKIAQELFKEKR